MGSQHGGGTVTVHSLAAPATHMPLHAGPAPAALTLGACQAQRSILALFELLPPKLCCYN